MGKILHLIYYLEKKITTQGKQTKTTTNPKQRKKKYKIEFKENAKYIDLSNYWIGWGEILPLKTCLQLLEQCISLRKQNGKLLRNKI